MSNNNQLPVDENKVIDKTIDVYLYMCDNLNTAEVQLLGQKLIDLANRRATDVELEYYSRKQVYEAAVAYTEEPDYDKTTLSVSNP